PYKAGLTPLPSHLRPHCKATERLLQWKPSQARTSPSPDTSTAGLSGNALWAILLVMEKGWAAGTRSTYGSGLLLFHVFCDEQDIAEESRCPANTTLLLAFIATYAGQYSGSTISNSIHGVRAWHLLHGARWAPSPEELALALTGAARLAPASSRRQKREPWTVDMITQVCYVLDPDSHFDGAWFAALTTIFWSMARTIEFLVPGLSDFRADRHITRDSVRVETAGGQSVMVFALPWTKVAPEGERVFWGRQSGPADPYAAFRTHMLLNDPPAKAALFSWRHAGAWWVMTRSAFIRRMEIAAAEAGLPRVHGHGLRIGAVLEYLLRGLSMEQVKNLGRWSGNSFALYLRKHVVVLAPYIQSVPLVQQAGPVLPPLR
ncbi:hypothetical protein M422DRAFT_162994, partial [Sphaerobolus stellatus SS14]